MSAISNLSSLSPYELGLTNSRDAIPHLVRFLSSKQPNDKRLAASAIRKLSRTYRNDCKTAIPALLTCLIDSGAQVRQYALKALEELELPSSALGPIRAVHENDEKEYNRSIADAILRRYAGSEETRRHRSSSQETSPAELLQSRIEECLDILDSLEEDMQENSNWLWSVEEKVTELRQALQNAEYHLLTQGIEGKNQAERQAHLASALTAERLAVEDAERQLRTARRAREEHNGRLSLLQHRLHALDLLMSLKRSREK